MPEQTLRSRIGEIVEDCIKDLKFPDRDYPNNRLNLATNALLALFAQAEAATMATVPEKGTREPSTGITVSDKQRQNMGWNSARTALIEAWEGIKSGEVTK